MKCQMLIQCQLLVCLQIVAFNICIKAMHSLKCNRGLSYCTSLQSFCSPTGELRLISLKRTLLRFLICSRKIYINKELNPSAIITSYRDSCIVNTAVLILDFNLTFEKYSIITLNMFRTIRAILCALV